MKYITVDVTKEDIKKGQSTRSRSRRLRLEGRAEACPLAIAIRRQTEFKGTTVGWTHWTPFKYAEDVETPSFKLSKKAIRFVHEADILNHGPHAIKALKPQRFRLRYA